MSYIQESGKQGASSREKSGAKQKENHEGVMPEQFQRSRGNRSPDGFKEDLEGEEMEAAFQGITLPGVVGGGWAGREVGGVHTALLFETAEADPGPPWPTQGRMVSLREPHGFCGA